MDGWHVVVSHSDISFMDLVVLSHMDICSCIFLLSVSCHIPGGDEQLFGTFMMLIFKSV